MKTKIKNYLYIIPFLLISLVSASSLSFAYTQEEISGLDCDVVVQNYNPAVPELLANQTSDNKSELCTSGHFETFPSAHNENDLSVHKLKSNKFHEPWTEHRHIYYNKSAEEVKNNDIYFKYSVIDTFEIQLEEDLKKNVDLSTIQCGLLPDGNNCEGNGYLPEKALDGSKIYYQVSFDKNKGIIRWHFPGRNGNPNMGTTGTSEWAKPYISGKNPTADKIFNITAEKSSLKKENRDVNMAINFKTNEVQKEKWSATSTSRILLKDVFIKVPKNTEDLKVVLNTPYQDFQHETAKDAPSVNYYWFPIGTTTTIWQKEPLTCELLNISTPVEISGSNALKLSNNGTNLLYAFKVNEVSFSNNKTPAGTKIKWTSTDPDGVFWTHQSPTSLKQVGESYTVDLTEFLKSNKIYFSGKGGINGSITADLILPAGVKDSPLCTETIPLKKENKCLNLIADFDENNPLIKNGEKLFKLKVTDLNFSLETPKDIQLKWESNLPGGEFYTISGSSMMKKGTVMAIAAKNDELYYKPPVTNIKDLKINVSIFNPKGFEAQCKDTLEINKCNALDLTKNKKIIIDGKEAQTYNLDVSFTKDIPADTKFIWTTTDPNGTFYTKPFLGDTYKKAGNKLEVPILTGIAYIGEGTVTVKVKGFENICSDYDIFQKKPVLICENLKVNKPLDIIEGKLSTFSAVSYDNNGDVFNGKIKYSVAPGFGLFYTEQPDNLPTNPSPYQTAYKLEKPISPSQNFCSESKPFDYSRYMNLPEIRTQNDYSLLLKLDTEEKSVKRTPKRSVIPTEPDNLDIGAAAIKSINDIFTKTEVEKRALPSRMTPLIEKNYREKLTPDYIQNGILIDTNNPISDIKLYNLSKTGRTSLFDIGDYTLDPEDLGEYIEENPINIPLGQTEIIVNPDQKVYFYGLKPGTDIISVSTECTTEKDCRKTFDIVPKEKPDLICKDLNTTITENGTRTPVQKLSPGNIYNVSAEAEFNMQNPSARIQMHIEESSGEFIEGEIPFILENFLTAIGSNLDRQFLERINERLGSQIEFTNDIIVNSGEEALLIIFSDNQITDPKALTVEVVGTDVADCENQFPLVVEPEKLFCESLFIKTPENFDKTKEKQNIFIRGNFENHDGTITVSVSGGKIARPNSDDFKNELVISNADVKNSDNNIVLVLMKNPGTELIAITAVADGAASRCSDKLEIKVPKEEIEPICVDLDIIKPSEPWKAEDKKEHKFEIKVKTEPSNQTSEFYYNWEITGSGKWKSNDDDFISKKGTLTQTIVNADKDTEVEVYASEEPNGKKIPECKDLIESKSEKVKKPQIEKMVFPEDEVKKADDLLNISDDTKYVTYIAIFTPGSAKYAEITEKELKTINEEAKISGNLGGKLTYKGMRINVVSEADSSDEDLFTAFRSDDYISDDSNNELLGDKKFDDDEDDDSKDYEERYDCENNSNDFCIEADDDFEENLEEAFVDGDAIKFKNLDKLGDDSAIVIKYQMKVETIINDEECKKLSVATGCGEKFNNEISFEAWADNSPVDGSDFEDDDDAKVIVTCPFVLKKLGGDSFFTEELDLGIDVSMCSEVKNDDGVDIIPEEEEKEKITKTGSGLAELPDNIKLDIPSHNICRFSNTDKNISGYQNELKNFSSTICELKAEVSENWKEKNINNAIKSNLDLITAWNKNLNNISTLNTTNLPKESSGIYVKQGDLTIDLGRGTLPTGKDYPAAQTYVIYGDLTIKSDIKYDESNVDFTKPKTIPSAAFIVIDGNIKIAPNVEEINGALIALDLDNSGDGKITELNYSPINYNKVPLKIYGSLFGDVFELFNIRRASGDPKKNQGAITIYYDQAIILNTPKGLGQLVDINQLKSVK